MGHESDIFVISGCLSIMIAFKLNNYLSCLRYNCPKFTNTYKNDTAIKFGRLQTEKETNQLSIRHLQPCARISRPSL